MTEYFAFHPPCYTSPMGKEKDVFLYGRNPLDRHKWKLIGFCSFVSEEEIAPIPAQQELQSLEDMALCIVESLPFVGVLFLGIDIAGNMTDK